MGISPKHDLDGGRRGGEGGVDGSRDVREGGGGWIARDRVGAKGEFVAGIRIGGRIGVRSGITSGSRSKAGTERRAEPGEGIVPGLGQGPKSGPGPEP